MKRRAHRMERGDASLGKAMKAILAEPAGSLTCSFEGRSRAAVFNHSPLAGLKFARAQALG